MKRHVLFSIQRISLLIGVVAFLFSFSASGATNYTYTTEGFEDATWPTSAINSETSIETTTGTWTAMKFIHQTSNIYAGTYAGQGTSTNSYIVSPPLTNGVDSISFYFSGGGSNRSVAIYTSTDGSTWGSAIATFSYTKSSGWVRYPYYIHSATAVYVKIAFPGGSGSSIDNVLITRATTPLSTPTVGSPTSATSSGFTANWTDVANASSYSVKIYKGTTLVKTVSVSLNAGAGVGVADSTVISGLTPDSTYTYTVTAIGTGEYSNSDESAKSSSVRLTNTDASITSFTLLGVSGVIDQTASTISVVVPYASDLTVALTPTVSVADHATLLTTGSQAFSSPVTYTVQAEDGTTKNYTVTVTKAAADSVCTIKTFSLNITNERVSINNTTGKITIVVPASADLSSITPTYTLTSSLSSITSPSFPANFNTTTTVTVTAESGKTKTYTLVLEKDGTAPTLTATVPVDKATGVSLAGTITLTYTDDYSSTLKVVDSTKITLSGGSGTLSSFSTSNLIGTINFKGLTSETTYTLTIGAGAYSDEFGNLTSDTTITFTTANGVNQTLPYYTHMDGSSFDLPAFITDPTTYIASADTKATVTTQYGAYRIKPGDTLTISTNGIGSIYINVYSKGGGSDSVLSGTSWVYSSAGHVYFSISNSANSTVTNDSITHYMNRGTSISQKIDTTAQTQIYIVNSSTSGSDIYIPFIYLSEVGGSTKTEKEVWCTSSN